jgi:hypothetical protein
LTLVELTVVSLILVVAMSTFSTTVANVARQRAIHRENAIASEAARSVLETMRSLPFEEVYATYDADPANDPAGAGSAAGRRFAVSGLAPRADDADGLIGTVRFPGVEVGDAGELREDVWDDELGMPRDLNADHVIDDRDHALDYIRLPVAIELAWQGTTGERRLAVHAMLCRIEFE